MKDKGANERRKKDGWKKQIRKNVDENNKKKKIERISLVRDKAN